MITTTHALGIVAAIALVSAAKITSRKKSIPMNFPPLIPAKTLGIITNIRDGPALRTSGSPFENEKTPCSCGFARFCEVKCEAVEPPSAPVLLSRPMKTARAFLSGRVFVRAIFFELRALASPNALLLLPV